MRGAIGEQHTAVQALLEAAGYRPYEIIQSGHRIGESKTGFVILESGDGKTLIRLRPGDDWIESVTEKQTKHKVTKASTAEYACLVHILSDWSRTLEAHGYRMGQRNGRTLVVLEGPKADER